MKENNTGYVETVKDIAKQIQSMPWIEQNLEILEGNIQEFMRMDLLDVHSPIRTVSFADTSRIDYSRSSCLSDENALENSLQLIRDIDNEWGIDWSLSYRVTHGFDLSSKVYITITRNHYKEPEAYEFLQCKKEEGIRIAEEAGIVREIDIDGFAWQYMLNYVQDVYKYGRRLTDVAGLNLDAVCDILEADCLKPMLEEMILSNLPVDDVPSFVSQYLRRPYRVA